MGADSAHHEDTNDVGVNCETDTTVVQFLNDLDSSEHRRDSNYNDVVAGSE